MDQEVITPQEWFLELARIAYDISSGGVGVQQSLVEALIRNQELSRMQQIAYSAGLSSNFIIYPPMRSVLTSGAEFGFYDPNLFGVEASDRIRQKYAALEEVLEKLRSYDGGALETRKRIEFHAGKLELMVDMLESAMEKARESGYVPPPEFDVTYVKWGTGELQTPVPEEREKWQASWLRIFGYELPTIYQLISKAKETVVAAQSVVKS